MCLSHAFQVYVSMEPIHMHACTPSKISQCGDNMFERAGFCHTTLNWSCTELLSPPFSAWPHVTTDPSPRMAAKAETDAWICCTLFSWNCCQHHGIHGTMWQQTHHPGVRQKPPMRLGSVSRPSAGLARNCCRHHGIHGPM